MGGRWIAAVVVALGVGLVAVPAVASVVLIVLDLADVRVRDPWEAALVADGWRAAHGVAVYELPNIGHATWMYGPAEPLMLGLIFKLTGPTKLVPQLLSLLSAAGLIVLCTLALRRHLPWPYLVLVGLTLIGADLRLSYFAEARPDVIACFFGYAGLLVVYRAGRSVALHVLGAALIVLAVSFKQPIAFLALVPPIATAISNGRVSYSQFALTWLLLAAIAIYLSAIYFLAPTVWFYAATVPAQYSINAASWFKASWAFLGAAACLWVTVAAALVQGVAPTGERKPLVWAITTLLLAVPSCALAFAKAGGTYNSFLPAWIALIVTSGLFASSPARARRLSDPTGAALFCVIGAAFGFTVLADPDAVVTSHGMVSVNQAVTQELRRVSQDAAAYPEVIRYAHSLGGTVVSPSDPTIELYAKGAVGRSLVEENDTAGWGQSLPTGLRAELTRADNVVTEADWWSGTDLLPQLGFEPVWSNAAYTVWRRRRA